MRISIENKEYEKKGRNLYKHGVTYYRLFSHGVSDNGCWLINPVMQEISDIDIATGKDVYGPHRIIFDSCGTIPADFEFITTEHIPEQIKVLEEKYGPVLNKRKGWKSIPGIPMELL